MRWNLQGQCPPFTTAYHAAAHSGTNWKSQWLHVDKFRSMFMHHQNYCLPVRRLSHRHFLRPKTTSTHSSWRKKSMMKSKNPKKQALGTKESSKTRFHLPRPHLVQTVSFERYTGTIPPMATSKMVLLLKRSYRTRQSERRPQLELTSLRPSTRFTKTFLSTLTLKNWTERDVKPSFSTRENCT